MTRLTLWPVLIGLLCLAPAARGQGLASEEGRRKALLEGTHYLRYFLNQRGLTPLPGYEALAADPGRHALIVLGRLEAIEEIPGGLKQFVENGGAVLLASDREPQGQAAADLDAAAGVAIAAETVTCQRLFDCYREEFHHCPLVFARPRGQALFQHRAVPAGARWKVATNVPSYLVPGAQGAGVDYLFTLPGRCVSRPPGDFIRYFPDPLPFGVGGKVGKGRIMVLADHSLFINQMMVETSNHNAEFADNLITWLKGDEDRSSVLFVEEGKVSTNFNIPVRPVNIPPEEALRLLFEQRNNLLVEGERILAELEDEDFFNRKLVEGLDAAGMPWPRLVRSVLILGTLFVVCWAVYRVGIRGRFRHETSVPPLTRALGENLPGSPLVEQRNRELLRVGNLGEPAALLVRRWFARQGLDVPAGPAPPPVFAVRGGWWRRWRLLRRLRWLWQLAAGQRPAAVSPPELWKLQRELDALHASRERGGWGPAPITGAGELALARGPANPSAT